jgi:hypothetical protein
MFSLLSPKAARLTGHGADRGFVLKDYCHRVDNTIIFVNDQKLAF